MKIQAKLRFLVAPVKKEVHYLYKDKGHGNRVQPVTGIEGVTAPMVYIAIGKVKGIIQSDGPHIDN